jgi:hypothetical protein
MCYSSRCGGFATANDKQIVKPVNGNFSFLKIFLKHLFCRLFKWIIISRIQLFIKVTHHEGHQNNAFNGVFFCNCGSRRFSIVCLNDK